MRQDVGFLLLPCAEFANCLEECQPEREPIKFECIAARLSAREAAPVAAREMNRKAGTVFAVDRATHLRIASAFDLSEFQSEPRENVRDFRYAFAPKAEAILDGPPATGCPLSND